MFALDRFSDYKANLDDILHVGNASDAAPDSFAAQENFLSQLEIEVSCFCFYLDRHFCNNKSQLINYN